MNALTIIFTVFEIKEKCINLKMMNIYQLSIKPSAE